MDLKQIEYFVQVAEMGSFTRASTYLQVAQPALSRQVRTLEVELRQPLFERTGRGVTLTEAGKLLLAHGRGILQQVERARQDLEDQRGAATGHLSIALPPSVSRTLTGPLVDGFRERFPKATLTVLEGLSTYALEWLQIGRVDCAFVYQVTPGPTIDLARVIDEKLYLVAARGDAAGSGKGKDKLIGPMLTLAEVARRELVIPSRPHSIRMLLETVLANAGLKPRVGLEIDSVPAILDLVERHGLHAVLSLNAVRSSGREQAYTAHPIGPPALVTTLWLATSAQRPRGPLIDQACELARELVVRLWR